MNVKVLPSAFGIDGDALRDEPVIVVRRGNILISKSSTHEDFGEGVAVTAYFPKPLQGQRECAHHEIVAEPERYDETVKNKLGLMGACVRPAPSEDKVIAAVERANIALKRHHETLRHS